MEASVLLNLVLVTTVSFLVGVEIGSRIERKAYRELQEKLKKSIEATIKMIEQVCESIDKDIKLRQGNLKKDFKAEP